MENEKLPVVSSAEMMKPKPTERALFYQKLHAINAELRIVEKKGRNDFHKYSYAREEDFLSVLRPLLDKHNIVIDVSCVEENRDGMMSRVKLLYTITDAETGFSIERYWFGYGEDKADKGIYKAYTGANKYFLYKFFQIPTSDDPEGDVTTDKSAEKKLSKKERDELVKFAEECGMTAAKFNLAVRTKYGISYVDLVRKQADEIMAGLAKKKEAEGLMQ